MKSESRDIEENSILKRKPSAQTAFTKVSLKNRDIPSYVVEWALQKVRFYLDI